MSIIDRAISWLYVWKIYGPRCPEFFSGCPCCEKWKEHDELFE